MKTTLFRTRALLDTLEEDLGKRLITLSGGVYSINPKIKIRLDTEDFESCIRAADILSDDEKIACYLRAIDIYTGDFCRMQSSENWVIPIAAFYKNLYSEVVRSLVPKLEERGRFEEGAAVCRKATEIDPYSESFWQMYMRCLAGQGKLEEVVTAYETMSKLLLSTYGVVPDRESRAIYRMALANSNLSTVSPITLMENLREPDPITGALLCDFEFFRSLYRAYARSVARCGDAVHIILFTVEGRMSKELGKRSLDVAMDNLENHLLHSFRKGDAVTRCSPTQFAVILQQANYENSCMVCRRVINGFYKAYPRTPINIDHYVQALEPSTGN